MTKIYIIYKSTITYIGYIYAHRQRNGDSKIETTRIKAD